MENMISPKYHMKLAGEVSMVILRDYHSNNELAAYIGKWQNPRNNPYNQDPDFNIYMHPNEDIDLLTTLQRMDGWILMKIAVDMGLETPDFIPSIATFRNEIKSSYSKASATFEKAFKAIESDPDTAIGLANSALESIVKEILKDFRVKTKLNGNKTLYGLASELLKEFKMFPVQEMPEEIHLIGSGILKACQGIEKIRSGKSNLHSRTSEDYLVKDSLYVFFIVNSVTTLGLFLNSFYKIKFLAGSNMDNDLPF